MSIKSSLSKFLGPNLFVSYIANDPDVAVCCDQALSQKEAEKAALMEKLAALQQDLAAAGMEQERVQREALGKTQQEKVTIGQALRWPCCPCALHLTQPTVGRTSVFQNAAAVLQSELRNLQSQFEESLNSHEDTKKSLIEQVRELNQQREHTQQEVRNPFTRFHLDTQYISLILI